MKKKCIAGNIGLVLGALFINLAIFTRCDLVLTEEKNETCIKEIQKVNPRWCFLIYMAADNELESAAINDLNELEGSMAVSKDLEIFVLLDKKGDGNENPQRGTVLYKVKNDEKDSLEIVSEKIETTGLDLGLSIEENMASKYTLGKTIDFVKKYSSSENYGLIIWGHGTGYKNSFSSGHTNKTRGVAVDDTSEDFMTTMELREAIAEKGLSVIAFDTCFGMLIETVYELKDCGDYFIASAGLVPSEGWDYKSLFNNFSSIPRDEMNSEKFCVLAENQFVDQYENRNFVISWIDLKLVSELVEKFDNFAEILKNQLIDLKSQEEMFDLFFYKLKHYKGVSYPCDMYIDIFSLADYFSISIKEAADLKSVLERGNTKLNIGVHFIPLVEKNVVAEKHSDSYIKEMEGEKLSQLLFVKDNKNWVPTSNLEGSFLDKLFYKNY